MADNQLINFNSQDVADMYRRNQYARMLQEQANAPIERPSYKGIEAPLNATQGAAKMAAALLAGYQYSSANESYAKEKAAAEQKMVAERERSNQAYTDFQAGIAPKPGFGASGSVGDYGGQEMPSQARSDSERLAHLLSSMGSADERVSRSAKNYLDYDATQAQEKARAAKDEITRKDKEAETKRLQDNADRTYGLQLEKLRQEKTAAPKPQLPPKGIEAQQELLNKRASVNSITEDLTAVLKDLHTGRLVLGPRRNLENELKNKLGNSTPESIRYSSFLNTMEKMRNDVVRLNTGTQTEGDSQRAMNELMGSLGDTKNVKNRIGELIGLSKRAGEQHETAVNTMRKEYGAEPMDFKSMAKTKPIMGGGAVDVLPTGATVSNWKQ